jgi:hypothetical protein
MDKANTPAPCKGAGEGATYRAAALPFWNQFPEHEISELPFALEYYAERAVQFADAVFDLDREAEGLDWASRVQARCDVAPADLYPCLPPGMIGVLRSRAERMLAHG